MAINRAREILSDRAAMGIILDIILLAREYAPNSSGPSPLAKNRIIKISDMIDIREVSVVVRMVFRKGLSLIFANFYGS